MGNFPYHRLAVEWKLNFNLAISKEASA